MHDALTARPIEILLVEDNPGDVRLTQDALKDAKVANTMHVVEDGVAALDFLYRRGAYEAVPRPDLILLDLNLPRKNGREVLKQIKQDEQLKCIPVVILTTSQADDDISWAYKLHANCYITKPVEFAQFIRVVRAIEEFWFTIVTLPSR
jgi:chemotaxis family two-component system response regulator Rcp1